MRAFTFVIAALAAITLAEARGCTFTSDGISAVNASMRTLDNIEDMQGNFFVDSSFMAKLRESIDAAIQSAPKPLVWSLFSMDHMTKPVPSHLQALKEMVDVYNQTVQTKKKELLDSLKKITQKYITAAHECLDKLNKLDEEKKLSTVPCNVIYQFKDITTGYIQAASYSINMALNDVSNGGSRQDNFDSIMISRALEANYQFFQLGQQISNPPAAGGA